MNWACTVKRKYFDAIKDGRKKYEVRKRVPDIRKGDILFVCCKDEVVKCEVSSTLNLGVQRAWYLYACRMCVDERKYYEYLRQSDEVNLIGLRLIGKVTDKELMRFRSAVSRNPQWFCKVNF